MSHSQANQHSPLAEFIAGAKAILPLVVGMIPFGIIFGTLAEGSLSSSAAIAMSALVFAGSAQFIALGLLSTGTAFSIIILTTFVVNLRHLLYSMSVSRSKNHEIMRFSADAFKFKTSDWLCHCAERNRSLIVENSITSNAEIKGFSVNKVIS